MVGKKVVGVSPHIRTAVTIESTMYDVVISLIPIILVSTSFYGMRVLKLLILAVITGVLTEFFSAKLLKQDNQALDGSGIVTVILFTLTLPAMIPYKVIVVGSFVSIFLGKMLFGGVGKNIFNPALVGRAFVMLSYPQYTYNYSNIDGTAGASIIPLMKYMSPSAIYEAYGGFKTFFWGSKEMVRSMGEVSIFAILLGLLFLKLKGHIKLKAPLFLLGTLYILYLSSSQYPLVYTLFGGSVFAAVFMITDMVTSPYTKIGLILYSISIGFLTFFIRKYTSQPEGITYAILIMNMCVPTINKYTLPRTFGGKQNMKKISMFVSLVGIIFLLSFGILKLDKVIENDRIVKELSMKNKSLNYIFGENTILGEDEDSKLSDEGYYFQPVYKEKDRIGYVVSFESKGYGKDLIKILLGINLDGEIEGLKILEQNETFGLGSKIEDKEWAELWRGRDVTYSFDKEIDAYTGATYTFLNVYKKIMEVLESFEFVEFDVEEESVADEDITEMVEELDSESSFKKNIKDDIELVSVSEKEWSEEKKTSDLQEQMESTLKNDLKVGMELAGASETKWSKEGE